MTVVPGLILPDTDVVEAGVKTIRKTLETIFTELANNPEDALEPLWHPRLKKYFLGVDMIAEKFGKNCLRKYLHSVEIRGEESSLEPLQNQRLAALLDMLDGSDLLERGLGNWCSSLVLFSPKRKKIITAVVGLSSKRIFYTKPSYSKCTFVREPQLESDDPPIIHELAIAKNSVELRDASLAFYGQKPGSLLSILEAKDLVQRLSDIAREAKEAKKSPDLPKLRIYNLAGNPMMTSLVEGKIDAILDLRGQKCHDAIPGFVIALRAGAVLRDLQGRNISEQMLVAKLATPEYKFKYVLARNEVLASQLVELVKSSA